MIELTVVVIQRDNLWYFSYRCDGISMCRRNKEVPWKIKKNILWSAVVVKGPTMPFGTNSKGTKHYQFVQVYASDDVSIKIGTRCVIEDFGGVFVLSRCFLNFSVIELSQISSFCSYRGIAILKIDTTISTCIFLLLVTSLKQKKVKHNCIIYADMQENYANMQDM